MLGLDRVAPPHAYAAGTSPASTKYVTTFPPKLIPDTFQVANYARMFSDAGLGRDLVNSIAIVIPSVVGQVVALSDRRG